LGAQRQPKDRRPDDETANSEAHHEQGQ
jgi:hypothetical protein